MKDNAGEALLSQSERLLQLLRSDAHQNVIDDVIDERERLIFVLAEAIANGAQISASESIRLKGQDSAIIALLEERRAEVNAELTSIYEARRAKNAYTLRGHNAPHFMDKAA